SSRISCTWQFRLTKYGEPPFDHVTAATRGRRLPGKQPATSPQTRMRGGIDSSPESETRWMTRWKALDEWGFSCVNDYCRSRPSPVFIDLHERRHDENSAIRKSGPRDAEPFSPICHCRGWCCRGLRNSSDSRRCWDHL